MPNGKTETDKIWALELICAPQELEEALRCALPSAALPAACQISFSPPRPEHRGVTLLFRHKGKEQTTKHFDLPLRIGRMLDAICAFSSQSPPLFIAQDIKLGKNLRLNTSQNILTHQPTERHVRLTGKEAELLCFLHRQPGRTANKEEILRQIWNYASTAETHTLETHIYRLRQKLEAELDCAELIVTKDNGYALNIDGL